MSSELKLLTNARKYVRKLVTECHNRKSTFSSLPETERNQIKSELQDHLESLKKQNAEIQNLKWQEGEDESWLQSELDVCETYFSKIRECMALLNQKVTSPSELDTARSLLKSPTAPLPEFKSREGEDLLKFFQDFEDVTSLFRYSEYDRFVLLKQQISGRALVLLNSLESDKQGYEHAKKLLTEALASKDNRIFATIKQISEIRMTYDSDPFEYVSQMRNLTQLVSSLNLGHEDFLRYFFWQGLNDSFKHHMTAITNSSKPTLKEINEKFFQASERYLEQKGREGCRNKFKFREKSSNDKNSASYAVNISYKNKSFQPCSLCSIEGHSANHPVYRCDKYPDAKAKLERLKAIKGCIKCCSLRHSSDRCTFRFRSKCNYCKAWHFNFLCLKKNPEGQLPTESSNKDLKEKSKESSNNLAVIGVLESNLDSETSILPTFSCKINGKRIRVLKDGGCQSNLISEKVADALNLKVIKDKVDLRINGINASQEYMSKVVEFQMQIGDDFKTIEALCFPFININLKLPGLGNVVRGFQNKGYSLADSFLTSKSTCIDDIDFILGSKSSYCIPDSEVIFGKKGKSVYSQTPYGIILKGDIDTLMNDLETLKPVRKARNELQTSALVGVDNKFCSKDDVDMPVSVCSEFKILDEKGNVVERELERATDEILISTCNRHMNYDNEIYETENSELNDQLVSFCIDHTTRNDDGRLVMPLFWNSKVSHLLGRNFNLSQMILKSNLRKLRKNPLHLQLMNEVIKEQEKEGIIERIENLDQFLQEHPESSFLPHMGVFKLSRETTKCRVVFLSNLCEKDPEIGRSISHNQAIHAGPCLNQKLTSALLHLKFDKYLLCFDISKAFNQIALNDIDSNRLLFLWVNNIEKEDFNIVGYRNIRLSFGLRCSPAILLIGLYQILILDSEKDPVDLQELKKILYALCYMDNLSYTTNDTITLKWAYDQAESIFSPYGFKLQQFVTNNSSLQSEIDKKYDTESNEVIKLLGMQWNRNDDTLSTLPLQLNAKAKTKREVLSSIASHFDLFGYTGPILNRSRLFLHELQCTKKLGWDDKLPREALKHWNNIVKQANATPIIPVKRFVGKRDSKFHLVACCDSSRSFYGVVVYIVDTYSMEVSFILAKNRIINKQLENKSIPALELQGVSFATEVVLDLYQELSGSSCVNPVSIVGLHIFSDSQVALSWLYSYSCELSKMQKRSVFVLNRIRYIDKLCERHPVHFAFIGGNENPADAITRCLSYRKLIETNFYSGPNFLTEKVTYDFCHDGSLNFSVPNPEARHGVEEFVKSLEISLNTALSQCVVEVPCMEHIIPPDEFSSFCKLVAVTARIIKFINNLKAKLKEKNPTKFGHLEVDSLNSYKQASKLIILRDQQLFFPDIFDYFNCKEKRIKDVPNLVGQLNIYLDKEGLLRVRSKCDKLPNRFDFPILLAKDSRLTSLVIQDLHRILNHSGCYSVLIEMRKRFYVPSYFSVVKKNIKECTACRRFNERTIKINQSPYREWRVNPPNVPFRYVFLDFIGPLMIKEGDKNNKVYLLCITCMWCRAVNLITCLDLSVNEFLRGFQIHSFQFGIPEYCISDLGSQLVSASNVIKDYMKDHETQSYFERNGVKSLEFDQFVKGHSQLGSMVEVCVKFTKRLIFGAIGKNIVKFRDFEFLIAHVVHLVNRRPVAFKNALRDKVGQDIPEPITPEVLIHGYDLISVNVIPSLHIEEEPDWRPVGNLSTALKHDYEQLKRVRHNLIELYQDEFIASLIHQAVDRTDRYKPISHKRISPGDVVLLKESFTKPHDYPMGLVKEIQVNDLGEVTGATIMKGKTRELVKRHSSVIIPLLTVNQSNPSVKEAHEILKDDDLEISRISSRPKRRAAIKSSEASKRILQQ